MESIRCLCMLFLVIIIIAFAKNVEMRHVPERTLNYKLVIQDRSSKDGLFIEPKEQLNQHSHSSVRRGLEQQSKAQSQTTHSLHSENRVLNSIANNPIRASTNKRSSRRKSVIFEKSDRPVAPMILNSIYSVSPTTGTGEHKNVDLFGTRDGLFSIFWKLLRHGQLHKSDVVSNDEPPKLSIMSEMVNGTALVIANCDVSIVHATMLDSNTVLSIFLDHASSQECENRISKKKLPNVFIAHMARGEVIKSILLARGVFIDFAFIMDFERLTLGLLPQEIEDIGKNLLSLSRTFLFTLSLQDEKLIKIFKSSWKEPKDLVDAMCARVVDGTCVGEVLGGSGYFWGPLLASIKNNKSQDTSDCRDEGLPLRMLLSYNLTSTCRRHLFHTVATSSVDLSMDYDVYIHGHVATKSHCQSLESQPSTANLLFNRGSKFNPLPPSKPSTYPASNTVTNSFDIVDGRPVEEESTLTKGYQELGQGESKPLPTYYNYKQNMLRSPSYPHTRGASSSLSNGREEYSESQKRTSGDPKQIIRIRTVNEKNNSKHPNVNTLNTNVESSEKQQDDFVIKRSAAPVKKKMFGNAAKSRTMNDGAMASRTNSINRMEWNHTLSGTRKKMYSDESNYKFLLNVLTPNLKEIFKKGKTHSGLVLGGCHMSMLSAKLSMNYPRVNLITLDTDKHQDCSKKFGSIVNSAELPNNFMVGDSLSPDVLYQISHTPQLFDFQILGTEVFSWKPQTGRAFSDYFARILSMSRVTFMEVPGWTTLKAAIRLFRTNYSADKDYASFQDFLSASMLTSNSKLLKVEDISESLPQKSERMHLWKVELRTIERKVFTSCNDGQTPSVTMRYNRPTVTLVSDGTRSTQQAFHSGGLNLKTLLSFHINNDHRKKLFESYLRVPLYQDMCPSRLFWSKGRLNHMDQSLARKEEKEELQSLTKFINKEIHQSIFSFIDYNSPHSRNGGFTALEVLSRFDSQHVGNALARKHPCSSFLLPEDSAADAEKKALKTEKMGMNNSLVLHLPVTQEFSHHLVKSPDIIRYQFIDLAKLLMTSELEADKDTFRTMVGELLSSGLTNFVTVPSSEILSLATSTIFSGVFDSQPYLISSSSKFFENAERTLLQQAAAWGRRKIRMHSTLQPSFPLSSPKGARSSWRLNTVRILQLQQQVDHHFEFELDQHERKYMQHVERAGGPRQPPTVYLVRQEDDYRIHYGNVSAISLIALLRMGLLPTTREKLYSSFLQLPLHEDMAPWNIVFQGGKLAYIDQDTRDKTFDKFIPMAYQIMSVLINYERTVKDFEHCGEKANTQYNFGQISSCVHSQFQGPCPNSLYPVPCGDGTCQPTFIHCLRTLQAMMKQHGGTAWQGSGKGTEAYADKEKEWDFDDVAERGDR